MNAEQKEYWLKTMRKHAAADRLIQGSWVTQKDDSGLFRGCFFGCAMQTKDEPLSKAAIAMGLPLNIVCLAERIFEGIPKEEALLWPVQLIEAVPVDTDLSSVFNLVSIDRMDRLFQSYYHLVDNYGLLDALNSAMSYHQEPSRLHHESSTMVASAVNTIRSDDTIPDDYKEKLRLVCASASATLVQLPENEVYSSSLHANAISAYYAASAVSSIVKYSDSWQQERDSLLDALKSLA